jgi:hypothetical protein
MMTDRERMLAIVAELRASRAEREAEEKRLKQIEEAKPMMKRWTDAYHRLMWFRSRPEQRDNLRWSDMKQSLEYDLEELTEQLTPDEQAQAALYKLSYSSELD